MMKTLLIASLAAAAAACTSAPAKPTWQADVLPIVASNCVRCHGSPAAFGAPSGFRLDVYDDHTDPATGLIVHGASTMMERIKLRVDDESMPPVFPLVGDEIDVFDHWNDETTKPDAVARTHAQPPDRGGARPGNHAPTLAIAAGAQAGDFDYQISDADFDVVRGTLLVGEVVVADNLHAGRGTVHVDTSQLPDGAHTVTAMLDDGVVSTAATTFDLEVTGNGATPIAIAFETPAPMDLLTDGDPRPLSFCANQAGVTATVRAIDPTGVHDPIAIPAGAAIAVAACTPAADTFTTVAWDHTTVAAASSASVWQIELEVTDGTHTVTTRSPPFRIGHGAATNAYADVKPTFDQCATCHYGCGPFPATLPYDFTFYRAPAEPDPAVPNGKCGHIDGLVDRNLPGLIYDHVVVRQDMPPASETPLTQAERDAVKAWLLGGSPP